MLANIIVDIILSALIVVCAIIGIKKGFISTISKPVKLILTIVLTFALCNAVATGIIEPIIKEPISAQLTSYLVDKFVDVNAANPQDRIPTVLKLAALMSNIDISTISPENPEQFVSELVNKLSGPTIHILALAIAFVVLYIVLRLLLSLIFMIINAIFDNGIFGVLNKILGFIFTTILALAVVWILVIIIGYIFKLPSFADVKWMADFEGGYIYRFFKKYTPLDLLLSF